MILIIPADIACSQGSLTFSYIISLKFQKGHIKINVEFVSDFNVEYLVFELLHLMKFGHPRPNLLNCKNMGALSSNGKSGHAISKHPSSTTNCF